MARFLKNVIGLICLCLILVSCATTAERYIITRNIKDEETGDLVETEVSVMTLKGPNEAEVEFKDGGKISHTPGLKVPEFPPIQIKQE